MSWTNRMCNSHHGFNKQETECRPQNMRSPPCNIPWMVTSRRYTRWDTLSRIRWRPSSKISPQRWVTTSTSNSVGLRHCWRRSRDLADYFRPAPRLDQLGGRVWFLDPSWASISFSFGLLWCLLHLWLYSREIPLPGSSTTAQQLRLTESMGRGIFTAMFRSQIGSMMYSWLNSSRASAVILCRRPHKDLGKLGTWACSKHCPGFCSDCGCHEP